MKSASRLPVTIDDIEAARQRIAGAVERTPCLHSKTLSRIFRCEVWLKFENLQFTASFKERGALNKLLSLSDDEKIRGVVAMSAGNHAQGVAYHAGRLGIPATIVMPAFTPFVKVRNTEGHGARVVLHGNTLAEASQHARGIPTEAVIPLINIGQRIIAQGVRQRLGRSDEAGEPFPSRPARDRIFQRRAVAMRFEQ